MNPSSDSTHLRCGNTSDDSAFAYADLFYLGDLRKVAEQYGDLIQWDQSSRAYIMTHEVSGVDWKHYKHLVTGGRLCRVSGYCIGHEDISESFTDANPHTDTNIGLDTVDNTKK
jgi:hypothetical protein